MTEPPFIAAPNLLGAAFLEDILTTQWGGVPLPIWLLGSLVLVVAIIFGRKLRLEYEGEKRRLLVEAGGESQEKRSDEKGSKATEAGKE